MKYRRLGRTGIEVRRQKEHPHVKFSRNNRVARTPAWRRNRIPLLGLGVWQVPDGPEAVEPVRFALEAGYWHINTAQAYGNEERSVALSVRAAFRARTSFLRLSSIERSRTRPPGWREACDDWGVSNFDADEVSQLSAQASVMPAVDQVQFSPQRQIPVLTKSTHRGRIEENSRIVDFTLSDSDIAALDALDQTGGTKRARGDKWW